MTKKTFKTAAAALLAATACAAVAWAQPLVPEKTTPGLHVPSTPMTVTRGIITSDLPPVAHIKSGETVRIDTVSHQGLTDDPVKFFAQAGIPASQVLKDAVDIATMVKRTEGFGGHVLTGPIYIDGAEPGDMLEVRMIRFDNRVDYGVNSPGTAGAAPGMLATNTQKIIKIDPKRGVALFAPGIEPPLDPFLGIMAVAPPSGMGARISSQAPGAYGGNMDFKRLTTGSTLYLPVFQKGALFVTGDSHATQGDGEVDGNALEASLTATLQFVVHKGAGKGMRFPAAEDADNYYVMGMDPDLNVALKNAIQEANMFLGKQFGLSPTDAYSLSSIAVDYSVAEAVDRNLVIYGKISKKMFKQKTPYWLAAATK
jgi:acetamidase/formamidase